MPIDGLLALVSETAEFVQLKQGLGHRPDQRMVVGLAGSQKALYVASLYRDCQQPPLQRARPVLLVTYSAFQAERLYEDLVTLLGPGEVFRFPALETLPHEEVSTDLGLIRQRIAVLDRLVRGLPTLVVAHAQALSERLIPVDVYRQHVLDISLKSRLHPTTMAATLTQMGFERVDMVQSPGHFSVRGGIIDVFPIVSEQPVRIELFDDEVDSIRIFDAGTQRSVENLTEVRIPPAREFLVPLETRSAGIGRILEEASLQESRLHRLGNTESAKNLQSRVALHAERLEQGVHFEGADQYKPFFYESLATLLDYTPCGSVIVDEPARVREHLTTFETEFAERHGMLLEKGRVLPAEARIYASWPDLLGEWKRHPIIYLSNLNRRVQGMEPNLVVTVSSRAPQTFHGNLERFIEEVKQWRKERYRVCMVLSTDERAERVAQLLKDEGEPALFLSQVNGQLRAGNVVVTTGHLETGGEFRDNRIVVLTDTELFGRQKRRRRVTKTSARGERIHFGDLKPGDYVVHVNHGIGRYLGVETLVIAGAHKDYLVVQYQGEDKLYVPTDQVDLLQKYLGVDNEPPKLYKLGGSDWARVKKRVKESVQEMAQGLLRLYAERESTPGHAFSPDTVWQQQFEDSFPYEETPDQARAIEEVKRDMERPRPMDRLLCGDVGYGKTEVAIRAAFKSVMDGKQVAVLVPTTILAQQHGRTFTERFEGYPITIKVLSRFQTAAEQKQVMRGVENGSVDIVIGTHRLLSKDLRFKDLGLIVVDEEQRFGVAQKERLKELRRNVDVLTLSATPIPRTLHMSMVGMRDMSIIETPPEDRFPVRTYVVEYDEELIREAILRELAREGQVYFVYNRVQSIDRMASRLMELVPEARIAVAHGQMDEDELEEVMLQFLQGEYDVLLCSTIIETGMDIPNVNTLVVYDADRLGLAQLYQLRGRVGRSNRVAYGYFTFRKDKVLTEDAEKRLRAIKEFTELGSGFRIAMRDLEIRGAGNLLGPEQHGFIASIGFELYCKLLEESIRELRGEVVTQPPEPVLDLNVDAYIPDDYVPDSEQKVEIYKKVLGVRSEQDATELADEIEDRFGDMPLPVQNLLTVARAKVLARRQGVASISGERDGIVLRYLTGLTLSADRWMPAARKYKGRVVVVPGRVMQVKIRTRGLAASEVLPLLESVLRDFGEFWEQPSAPSAKLTTGAVQVAGRRE